MKRINAVHNPITISQGFNWNVKEAIRMKGTYTKAINRLKRETRCSFTEVHLDIDIVKLIVLITLLKVEYPCCDN